MADTSGSKVKRIANWRKQKTKAKGRQGKNKRQPTRGVQQSTPGVDAPF
jgi:hypothetical protein